MKDFRLLAAHEIGHAVHAYIFDAGCVASKIVLTSDKLTLGYTDFENGTDRDKVFTCRYSKFTEISYIGGIFGELLYTNKWNPWSAREDIDSLICMHRDAVEKHALLKELDTWLWNSQDPCSFSSLMLGHSFKDRYNVTISKGATEKILPTLYKEYLRFERVIYKRKYKMVIDQLQKTDVMAKEELDIIYQAVIKPQYRKN